MSSLLSVAQLHSQHTRIFALGVRSVVVVVVVVVVAGVGPTCHRCCQRHNYTVSGKNGPPKQNAVTCAVYNTIQ